MCACLRAAAVVLAFDRLPGHALLHVHVLLGGEEGGEEELLQRLVGKVDAHMLGVHVEANRGCRRVKTVTSPTESRLEQECRCGILRTCAWLPLHLFKW